VTYSRGIGRHPLRKLELTEENISPDVRTEWAIESESGRPLRCIVLYWKHWPGHDMQVEVSQAPRWVSPCPRETAATPVT
jgi:hypothetical protein